MTTAIKTIDTSSPAAFTKSVEDLQDEYAEISVRQKAIEELLAPYHIKPVAQKEQAHVVNAELEQIVRDALADGTPVNAGQFQRIINEYSVAKAVKVRKALAKAGVIVEKESGSATLIYLKPETKVSDTDIVTGAAGTTSKLSLSKAKATVAGE